MASRSAISPWLAALLLLLTLPVAVKAQDYIITTNNDTITIVQYTGVGGSVTIPDTINNLTVIRIGSNAFENCSSLTNITICDNVICIGDRAFSGCDGLVGVVIGNSVTTIGMVHLNGASVLRT